jgi:hypothetical protein
VKNSEIRSSPAALGYRQRRHKRKTKTLRTRWLPPADKNARKRKTGVRGTFLQADLTPPEIDSLRANAEKRVPTRSVPSLLRCTEVRGSRRRLHSFVLKERNQSSLEAVFQTSLGFVDQIIVGTPVEPLSLRWDFVTAFHSS